MDSALEKLIAQHCVHSCDPRQMSILRLARVCRVFEEALENISEKTASQAAELGIPENRWEIRVNQAMRSIARSALQQAEQIAEGKE